MRSLRKRSNALVLSSPMVLTRHQVTFGVLFNDDLCANIFEALVGTLRVVKKNKIVAFPGELLLQVVHDKVEITLRPPPPPTQAVAATS
ncbi:Costars family protein [Hirschfeldia incana]|nr:Costars family protein [Hirschfeldia incana]